MLDPTYYESETRFTQKGEEVILKSYPSKMSIHSIATVLYLGLAKNPKVFNDFFMQKVSPSVEESFNHSHLLTKKPSKQERDFYKNQLDAFKTIFESNLERVIENCLKSSWKSKDYMGASNLENADIPKEDRNAVNSAIFNRNLIDYVTSFINSQAIKTICEDYKFVKSIYSHPERFSELEEFCKWPLWHFMHKERVRDMDIESQYQEGLLVIWKCAQLYKGKNFARFNTLVRKSLHNKYANLLRYFSADIRRTHKYTKPMGAATDPEESYLTYLTDRISFNAWRKAQIAQLSKGAIEEFEYDPFLTFPVIFYETYPQDEEKVMHSVFKDNLCERVNTDNYPYSDERNIGLIENWRLKLRLEDLERHEYSIKFYSGSKSFSIVTDELMNKIKCGEYSIDGPDKILKITNPSALLEEYLSDVEGYSYAVCLLDFVINREVSHQ